MAMMVLNVKCFNCPVILMKCVSTTGTCATLYVLLSAATCPTPQLFILRAFPTRAIRLSSLGVGSCLRRNFFPQILGNFFQLRRAQLFLVTTVRRKFAEVSGSHGNMTSHYPYMEIHSRPVVALRETESIIHRTSAWCLVAPRAVCLSLVDARQ